MSLLLSSLCCAEGSHLCIEGYCKAVFEQPTSFQAAHKSFQAQVVAADEAGQVRGSTEVFWRAEHCIACYMARSVGIACGRAAVFSHSELPKPVLQGLDVIFYGDGIVERLLGVSMGG